MELLIVRHAIAEERRPGLVDADRELTPRGQKRFARHVQALARLDLAPDRVLHSPWRRAVDTAAMFAPICAELPRVEPSLAQPPSDALLAALMDAARPGGRLAVVGHEPWLSELASWLIFGRPDGGEHRLRVKKGAALLLRGAPAPGAMQLTVLLPPRVLRLLAD